MRKFQVFCDFCSRGTELEGKMYRLKLERGQVPVVFPDSDGVIDICESCIQKMLKPLGYRMDPQEREGSGHIGFMLLKKDPRGG